MQTQGLGDKSVFIQLKQAEDLVTKQGVRVVKLRGLKQIAIENEDYMTAKNIKTQISNIEQAVTSIDTQTGSISHEILTKLNPAKATAPKVIQKQESAENMIKELNQLQK